MRPDAAAPTEPSHTAGPGSNGLGRERAQRCDACAKHELAIDGLTQALAGLRRGFAALRDENAELRAELSRLQAHRIGA
jgi:hypothetical protein